MIFTHLPLNPFFLTFNFCVLFQTKPSAHIVASYVKRVSYSTYTGTLL